MVGTGRRLAQLSRTVAERRLRPVLRGAVRATPSRQRDLRLGAAADAEVGDRHLRSGAGLPGLPARSYPQRRAGAPGARLQQGRRRPAHAPPVPRRRRVLQGRSAVLFRIALQESGNRRPARRDGGRVGAIARAILRALDLRVDASESEVFLQDRHRAGRARVCSSTSNRKASCSTSRSRSRSTTATARPPMS